jgi:hypothetical protein
MVKQISCFIETSGYLIHSWYIKSSCYWLIADKFNSILYEQGSDNRQFNVPFSCKVRCWRVQQISKSQEYYICTVLLFWRPVVSISYHYKDYIRSASLVQGGCHHHFFECNLFTLIPDTAFAKSDVEEYSRYPNHKSIIYAQYYSFETEL